MSAIKTEVRSAGPDDMKFILSSWKSSWRTSQWAGCVRNDLFFKTTEATIEGLISRGAQFLLAIHPDTGRILSWVCYEVLSKGEACVHYLYTKDAFLKYGLGEWLVGQVPGTRPGFYTHRFRQVVDACPNWKHAPEIARRR